MTTGNEVYTQDQQKEIQQLLEFADGAYSINHISEGLSRLMRIQNVLAQPIRRKSTNEEYLTTCSFALVVEVGELLNELPWKPWKKNQVVDINRVTDEIADVLAFLGNVLDTISILYPQITAYDIARAYITKCKVNKERFLGNVDQYGIG